MVRKLSLRADEETSTQALALLSVDMVVERCEKRPTQQGAQEPFAFPKTKAFKA
jgi:hypothetical protein